MSGTPIVHVVQAWPAKGGSTMNVAAFDTEAEALADRARREARYPAWRSVIIEATVNYR